MKRFLATIALAVISLAAMSQTTMKVKAPNLVADGEQFNLTFIVDGEDAPSDFQWSAPSEFKLIWGPQKGTSSSISIINGQRSKSSQTTFTYILMPKSTGKFTIPAATATVKGKTISSGTHSIEVVSDGGSAQAGQSGGGQAQQGSQQGQAQTGSISNEDIFLRLSVSKTNVMVGETVSATLKLYQRANIVGFEDARFPTFNGFWSQETLAPTNIDFQRENIGDKIYNAAVIRSWNLIPQQAGDVTIEPAELVCLVNIRAPRASTGSILDSFFQDEYQTVRKRVGTSAVKVHVAGLPAGAPASFKGGVGSFDMKVALSKDELKTHDAASLKVTVTGKGNTTLLEAPKVNFPTDFEVYDVKTTDIAGGKVFEYPFIPRSHGEFVIDPVEYSYFDVNGKKYVTLTSQPLEIKVEKGAEGASESAGQLVQQGVNRKDVRNVGSDIRFIETKLPSLVPVGTFFTGSFMFWAVAALLVILALAAFFSFKGLAARRADVVGSKKRSATKMARKRLSLAGDYLAKNLYTAFYEELHKALLGFISDKLVMDAAEMSKENIASRLCEKGVSEGLASEFTGLLDACEFARYAPDAGHDAMNAHYESAVNVISAIDDSMKRKKMPSGAAATVIAALLMLVPSFGVSAADADSLWNAGTEAYAAGRWDGAVNAWNAVREMGLESPELYYNLGNAFFKNGDIAHAILNYERALKLDPSYSDAKFNLEFAQASVQDKIEEVPELFIKTLAGKICWLMSSDGWAALSLIFLAAFLAMLLVFLLGRSTAIRKAGFFAGIALLLCVVFSSAFAFWQKSDYKAEDTAIVTRAVCSVKSSPGSDSATNLFVLHEGTKVWILDSVGEWDNIELADGRQGWLKASDIEGI